MASIRSHRGKVEDDYIAVTYTERNVYYGCRHRVGYIRMYSIIKLMTQATVAQARNYCQTYS